MKYSKMFISGLSAVAILAFTSLNAAYAKSEYTFYLSKDSSFSQKNGTLDEGGNLNVIYNGEKFTGRNANNVIETKGDKGHTMTCKYEMPDEIGTGTCHVSDGTVLKMKFE